MPRLALLGDRNGWHVRDLMRAASQAGWESSWLDFHRLCAGVGGLPTPLADYPVVLVRSMPPGSLEQVVFRMDILHRVQAQGTLVVNPPAALEAAIDKYLASARLEAAGLPVPPTAVCQHADEALAAFEQLGGDVIVKPLFGSEGRGMLRVSERDLAWRTFRTLERLQCVLYLQKVIAHPGWDLRVFVLGDRVLAAMRRWARSGWRTNVAQGGQGEAVTCSPQEEHLALAAAAAIGAPIAGIDLLPGPKGEWYVLEVNAVPGWRALAPLTGRDIAAEIIHFIGQRLATHSTPALPSDRPKDAET